jgi:citrate lyase beta subunit
VVEVVGQAGHNLDCIMLPKVQSAAHVQALDLLLTQIEKSVGLEVGREAMKSAGPKINVSTRGLALAIASIANSPLAVSIWTSTPIYTRAADAYLTQTITPRHRIGGASAAVAVDR